MNQNTPDYRNTAAAMTPADKQAGPVVQLGDRVEIYPARPRADLKQASTQVYEARDTSTNIECVAIVCENTLPRVGSIGSYKNLKVHNVVRLVDARIVYWPPDGRERFVFVYETPPKRRMLDRPDGVVKKIPEERIIEALIAPVLEVLAAYRNIDLVHGAINPMNLFFAGIEGAETTIVGECLSGVPSFHQPALFETVERSMAMAAGRGVARTQDDLYAFGICVAMAARGMNFMADKTPDQIIEAKIKEGSYGMVIGRERLPAGISEFLRGVLSDDESQRWDIDEATRWLDGRRLSPKQPKALLRAGRPYYFKEKKFWDLRSLSWAFSQNVPEAAKEVELDQFDLWVKRNFEDIILQERMDMVWDMERQSTKEKLVSSICMVMDPSAPIRYKGLSLYPSGFGHALSQAYMSGTDLQPYGEMISQQLFSMWLNLRFEEVFDAAGMSAAFEKSRSFLTQKIAGYGMERVLYALSGECPCLSPVLSKYYVLTPGHLLLALESLARDGYRKDNILDRHMIAFISVREPKMIDPFLGYITSADDGKKLIGTIRCFSFIQRRFGTGPLPALMEWIVSLSSAAVAQFNDKDLGQEIQKKLGKEKSSGVLAVLLEYLDDQRVVQDDARRFAYARLEYKALGAEKQQVETYLRRKKVLGQVAGRQAAMVCSSVLASLCILGYVVFYFLGRL